MKKVLLQNNLTKLNHQLERLNKFGSVKTLSDGFSFLDVSDEFIHKIFPLIEQEEIKKPDYFDEKTGFIGAHISIIYPEEGASLLECEAGKSYQFNIDEIFKVAIMEKLGAFFILKASIKNCI